jgi:hypothetical protein
MASGPEDFHEIRATIFCLTRITRYAIRRRTVRACYNAPVAANPSSRPNLDCPVFRYLLYVNSSLRTPISAGFTK